MLAETAVAPVAVEKSVDAVFKVVTEHSIGSGFFVRDNKTFVTSLDVVRPLFQNTRGSSAQLGIFIVVYGEMLEVKSIKFMSFLHNQVVLEVEGYNGPFLQLSNSPVSESDPFYVFGFLQNKKNIHTVSGRIDSPLSKPETHHAATSYKVNALENIAGMYGGPMLNQDGQVIGVFDEHLGDLPSSLYVLFAQKFSPYLLQESLGITSVAFAKRYFIQARAKLERLAKKGDTTALYALSRIFKIAGAVEQRYFDQYMQYLEKAAEAGHGVAQLMFFFKPSGYKDTPSDELRNTFLMRKFADEGNAYLQVIFARRLLLANKSSSRNVDQAMRLLYQAAEQNNVIAQLLLVRGYRGLLKGFPADEKLENFWNNKLMQRGFAVNNYIDSYFYFGFGLYYGLGDVADQEKGRAIFEELAELGDSRAQVLLSTERGVPQNKVQATVFLKALQEAGAKTNGGALGASYNRTFQDHDQAKVVIQSIVRRRNSKGSSLLFSCADQFMN